MDYGPGFRQGAFSQLPGYKMGIQDTASLTRVLALLIPIYLYESTVFAGAALFCAKESCGIPPGQWKAGSQVLRAQSKQFFLQDTSENAAKLKQ